MNQIEKDIQYIKSILPTHYTVEESKQPGNVHCYSSKGICHHIDADDEEHWEYIYRALKAHFEQRFQEVFLNVCHCYKDFTIYLKPIKLEEKPKMIYAHFNYAK
jgi:hypothetical protein